jgi:hypothetical protein
MRQTLKASNLLAAIAACGLLAACTTTGEQASPGLSSPLPSAVEATSEILLPPTETSTADPGTGAIVPAATSRGPDLQATDPTTVRLDSGELQLVEFFRFT